jgi:hypothetical protein
MTPIRTRLIALRWSTAKALCALGVIALAGCAATGQNHIDRSRTKLSSAKVATSFADFPPVELKLNATHPFKIGADTAEGAADLAIVLDDNEAVLAKVFKLPPWGSPYSVQIASMVMGGLNDPAIFYPRYITLDEKFKPIRRGAASDFTYRAGGAFGAISATLFVNESNRDEAYLAIAGESRGAIEEQRSTMQSAGSTPVAVPVKGFLVMWMIPSGGTELPKAMRGAAGGELVLQHTSYAPKRFE